jgi:hypothetical protein
VLRTACERLDARGWARLADRLARGDPHGQVAGAWQAKESTRDLYRARNTRHARRTLAPLYAWAQTSGVPSRLAGTLRGWQEPIIAWHTTGGASNGPTEAVNLLVKKINRTGHGSRNFANHRLGSQPVSIDREYVLVDRNTVAGRACWYASRPGMAKWRCAGTKKSPPQGVSER